MKATTARTLLAGRVQVHQLPIHHHGDAALVPVDLTAIPLRVVRSFLITAPDGTVRGGHGHRSGSQLLFRIGGTIEVELAHDGRSEQVTLDERTNAVTIRSPVWSRQTYRGESAGLLVFCDTPYDPDSYLHERPD